VTDKIAIIGFGNIASAIVTPLLDNKLIQPENVFCVVKTEKSLENIKKNYKKIQKDMKKNKLPTNKEFIDKFIKLINDFD